VPGESKAALWRVTARNGDESEWLYRAGERLRQNRQGMIGYTIRQHAQRGEQRSHVDADAFTEGTSWVENRAARAKGEWGSDESRRAMTGNLQGTSGRTSHRPWESVTLGACQAEALGN
jgi:hypothetical protein